MLKGPDKFLEDAFNAADTKYILSGFIVEFIRFYFAVKVTS